MTNPTRKIVAIAAAGAVALVLIWYMALMRPQAHNLAAAHKAHAAAEQKIATLDSQLAGLRALVKQVPADRARLGKYTAAVPDTPSLDTALKQLQQAATSSGVTLSSVGPSTPASTTGGSSSSSQSAPGGPAITLSMTATGSYPALTNFLRQIASIPRALTVDSLSLASGGSGSELSANIGARIFYTGAPTP
jgi:Tfp pilus assembly protein PilO